MTKDKPKNIQPVGVGDSTPLSADKLFEEMKELRETIAKTNPELLQKFDETVGTALEKTLDGAINDTFGQSYLSEFKEKSDFWSEFKKNPPQTTKGPLGIETAIKLYGTPTQTTLSELIEVARQKISSLVLQLSICDEFLKKNKAAHSWKKVFSFGKFLDKDTERMKIERDLGNLIRGTMNAINQNLDDYLKLYPDLPILLDHNLSIKNKEDLTTDYVMDTLGVSNELFTRLTKGVL